MTHTRVNASTYKCLLFVLYDVLLTSSFENLIRIKMDSSGVCQNVYSSSGEILQNISKFHSVCHFALLLYSVFFNLYFHAHLLLNPLIVFYVIAL